LGWWGKYVNSGWEEISSGDAGFVRLGGGRGGDNVNLGRFREFYFGVVGWDREGNGRSRFPEGMTERKAKAKAKATAKAKAKANANAPEVVGSGALG
jgi:hypothetical protein